MIKLSAITLFFNELYYFYAYFCSFFLLIMFCLVIWTPFKLCKSLRIDKIKNGKVGERSMVFFFKGRKAIRANNFHSYITYSQSSFEVACESRCLFQPLLHLQIWSQKMCLLLWANFKANLSRKVLIFQFFPQNLGYYYYYLFICIKYS